MKLNTASLSILLLVVVGRCLAKEEVAMIIELTRHGTRMSTGWHRDEKWTKGLIPGQLTPVGKRMHYLLGKEVRSRYPTIFEKGLKHDEFYIRSSAIPRAIESGISHMFGLWDQFSDYELPFKNDDKRVQPPQTPNSSLNVDFKTPLPEGLLINPFHTEPVEDDSLLLLWDSNQCPWGIKQLDKIYNEVGRKLESSKKFKAFVKEAHTRYDIPYTEENLYTKCINLGDFAAQDTFNNPSPRIRPDEDLFKLLTRCYEAKILTRYTDLTLLKLHNSALVSEISEKLSEKASPHPSPALYHYYSAHDSTLSGLLSAAGLLSARCVVDSLYDGMTAACPPFPQVASNVIFELVRDDGLPYVKMMYDFEAVDVCRRDGVAANAGFRCPLEEFLGVFKGFGDVERKEYCFRGETGNEESGVRGVVGVRRRVHTWKVASAVLGILIWFLVIGWCSLYFKLKKAKKSGNRKLKNVEVVEQTEAKELP